MSTRRISCKAEGRFTRILTNAATTESCGGALHAHSHECGHNRIMFTGLVESLGTVRDVVSDGTGTLLRIEEPVIAKDLQLGASVAVNGVCLSVVAADKQSFSFHAVPEPLPLPNPPHPPTRLKSN